MAADVVILLLIFVPIFIHAHEFGHFLMARWCGLHVERMRIGVGPAWHSWKDRRGTEFCIGIFPAAFTELSEEVWNATPPLRRMLVASAGPAMNLFCALVLLLLAYLAFPPPSTALVRAAESDGAAYRAGMLAGDIIVSVDGRSTGDWTDVGLHMLDRIGDTGSLTLEVSRNGEPILFEMPVSNWQSDAVRIDMLGSLGIAPDNSGESTSDIASGIGNAMVDTARILWSTAMAGFKMIFGDLRIANFLGGLQIGQLGLDASALGTGDYLRIAALFSIGFAVINMLPGPVVDGYAMLIGAGEWIRGRTFPPIVRKVTLPIGIVLAFGPLALCIGYEIFRALS